VNCLEVFFCFFSRHILPFLRHILGRYAQMELFALWRDKDPQVMLARAEGAICGLLAILEAHPSVPSTSDPSGSVVPQKHSVYYSSSRLVACQVYGRAGLVYMKFHLRQKAMDFLVRAMMSAKREFGVCTNNNKLLANFYCRRMSFMPLL